MMIILPQHRLALKSAIANDHSSQSSQATYHQLCVEKNQRATAHSETGTVRGCGVAEALPGYQVDWSEFMYFLFFFVSVAHMEFPSKPIIILVRERSSGIE
jgi:hypothetical protein